MKKIISLLLFVLIVGSVLTACSNEKEESLFTMHFAHSSYSNQRDLFIALDKGYFKDNGLDVQLENMTVADIIPAIAGGHLAGASVATMSVLPAVAQGIEMKLVASGPRYDRVEQLTSIAVLNDSTIQTVQDLNGKTIASHEKGGGVWLWVEKSVQPYGIEFSQYVGAPTGEYQSMLISGATDCGVIWPYDILDRYKGMTRSILPLVEQLKEGTSGAWFSASFIEEHSDKVEAFLKALDQAHAFEAANQQEAFEIATRYTSFTMDRFNAELVANAGVVFPEKMVVDVWTIQNIMNAMLEYNLLDASLDINNLIDTRFEEAVWKMPDFNLDLLE